MPDTFIDGDMDSYKRCVDLNKTLMDLPEETVRRVLQDLGVDINI